MSVRQVVFDAVGTLIYATPDVVSVYHETGRRHGSKLTRDEVASRFQKAFRDDEQRDVDSDDSRSLQTSETAEQDRWRHIVAEVLSDADSTEACFEELFRHFGQADSWSCFEDVGPALTRLGARGLRFAIASNFDRRLHAICDGLPPLSTIPHRVVSSEVGFRKPSGSFYDALLSEIGSPPDEVLMVGDDLENDVRGARAVGLNAVLLSRREEAMPPREVTTVRLATR